jgi:hypothetical protein
MFQPLERTLTTAFCRKPLRNSLFPYTSTPPSLIFSYTWGLLLLLPLPPLPTAKAETPERRRHRLGRRRGCSAASLGSRLAWRHKVTPSSPFPPSQGSPPAQDLAARSCSCSVMAASPFWRPPSFPAIGTSTSSIHIAPETRSSKWLRPVAAGPKVPAVAP